MHLPTLTAVFPSSSDSRVAPPLLLATLIRLLLRGGPIMLCGRDFGTVSGETFDACMLCGRAFRLGSGVAGGEAAVAIAMVDETALIRAQSASGAARVEIGR